MLSRHFSIALHKPKGSVIALIKDILNCTSQVPFSGTIGENGFQFSTNESALEPDFKSKRLDAHIRSRRNKLNNEIDIGGVETLGIVLAKNAISKYKGPLPVILGEYEEDETGTNIQATALMPLEHVIVTLLPLGLGLLILLCGLIFPQSLILELGWNLKVFTPICFAVGFVGILFAVLNVQRFLQNVKRAKEVLRFLIFELSSRSESSVG